MPLPKDGNIVVFTGPVPRSQTVIRGSLISPRVPDNFPVRNWALTTPQTSGLSGYTPRANFFRMQGMGDLSTLAWQQRFIDLPVVSPPRLPRMSGGMGDTVYPFDPGIVGIAKAYRAGAISARGAQFAAEAVMRGRP